ncbi:peptide ABC transporter permease [Vallitalea longa]|uniref:Peptide ABC transporter permease n=1 Tax=Vallitalea longa TaxID=2936439 RepID=A0A9W5Y9C1_9FIRM|nr:ABC transporter permease [Vallitalea longa]GKX29277.1 peptide ABC transporter permease [Vallitalea longa]
MENIDIKHESDYKKPSFLEKYSPLIKYILKRLLLIIPVILIISFFIFSIVEFMPGDPLNAFLNPEQLTGTPEEIEQKRLFFTQKLGLNDPFIVRFFRWWKQLLSGEFGYSVIKNRPVKEFIGEHILNSFKANLLGFALAFVLSIVIGIKSAVKKNSIFDKFFTVFSIAGISLPRFFLAMLLIFLFSITLKWLPISGMTDPMGYRPDFQYYILPVLVITLAELAFLLKYVRNSMLEVLKQDYIRTARAKGLSEKVVIYRHAFRNALIPIVTLLGANIPLLFSGSIIVEKIFVWPGIGNLINDSYKFRDRSVLIVALIFFALLTLLGNLMQDVGYSLVDPRIREGGKK